MPKIILEFTEHTLTARISLADILRVWKILDLGFDLDWEEIDDERMDRERD